MIELTLSVFQPEDQDGVREMILAGLVDHWGFLDPTKNPDLVDIASSYADATFLVARAGKRIVGCGALVPCGSETGEIVRMSVVKDLRRQGIGRKVLNALIENARAQGFRQVVLETTAAWSAVVEFYLCNGFKITHYQDEDVYFSLDL